MFEEVREIKRKGMKLDRDVEGEKKSGVEGMKA